MGDLLEFSFMAETFFDMLHFVPVTLFLTFTSMVLAIGIGLLSALVIVKEIPVLRQLVAIYILLGRATPTMVMLYLVYFGLPIFLMAFTNQTGIDTGFQHIPPMLFAIVALTLHTGAYLAEIFRSAFLSVENGQMEAALSVGMTWFQGFYRIILKQAALILGRK